MKNLFVILIIVSALFSCSSTEKSITKSNKEVVESSSNEIVVSGKYIILELNGENLKNRDFGDRMPIMSFNSEQKLYSTNIGCNQINGSYTIESDSLSFLPGMSTMMACPDDLEFNYIKTLGEVDTYKVEDFKLLVYKGGELRIVFLPLKK